MFWRFSAYTNLSSLNNLLEKPEPVLEEILNESDLLSELKESNSRLIEYLRDENTLRQLVEHVVQPPQPRPVTYDSEEEEEREQDSEAEHSTTRSKSLSPFRRNRTAQQTKRSESQAALEEWETKDKQRARHAYTASEILSSDTWSILEALMENRALMLKLWAFVQTPEPLDMTSAAYFTKINETFLDKKTPEMMLFLKSLDEFVPSILKHIDCAAIMDLLLKIISMEKTEGGYGIADWLQSGGLIPSLLSFLEEDNPPSTQTSAGDFLKAIVTISANASQNEQSCIGPNNLTRQLVSQACIEDLLSNMLRGGNTLTVGVGLIIEIIRKNNSDYDPELSNSPDDPPSSGDPIYLGTMLRCFSQRIPDLMKLLLSSTHSVTSGDRQMTVARKQLDMAFGGKIEPLGFDRFKTCELMAELLHCSNMGLLNEPGAEDFVRQRDAERERLKSEGQLRPPKAPESMAADMSEDSLAFANSAMSEDPPSLPRKLEVANSSSCDDGFEDIGHDIGNDESAASSSQPTFPAAPPVSDVSEKSEPQTLNTRPRMSFEQDFLEEPISSSPPDLNATAQTDVETTGAAVPEPLKPKAAQHFAEDEQEDDKLEEDLDLLDMDQDEAVNAIDSLMTQTIDEMKPPEGDESAPNSLHDPTATLHNLSPFNSGIRKMSPHPEDRPAPLFAASDSDIAMQVADTESTNPMDPPPSLIDNAPTKAPNREPSSVYGENQPERAEIPPDVDGQPIVGDYLKMMFVEYRVVPTILDFFFRFPWNNFLHNVVYDFVQQVFNGYLDRGYNQTLAVDLFHTGRIIDRIIEGQAHSDEAQAKSRMRLGYMGHLTLIAEEVVKFSDRQPPDLLPPIILASVTSQAWNEYVETTLSDTRERDNAILGGVRPEPNLGPRQTVLNAVNAASGGNFVGGPSAALADAGLNGNIGSDGTIDYENNGSATSQENVYDIGESFAGSTETVPSEFAGSSGEENEEEDDDDDDDDDDEDDDGEDDIDFGDRIEGTLESFDAELPSMSSVSVPPSDPPPTPPPLNLPPSRARRQLAARLALHNNTGSNGNNGNGFSSRFVEAESSESIGQSSTPLPSRSIENDFPNESEIPIASQRHDHHGTEIQEQEREYQLPRLENGIQSYSISTNPPPLEAQDMHDMHDDHSEEHRVKHEIGQATNSNISANFGRSMPRHFDLDDFANSPAVDVDFPHTLKDDDPTESRGNVAGGR